MATNISTVSLRAAAKALGMPPTSLTRWLESEPTLARAVLQQPGPRRAMVIDLESLQAAWAALQAGTTAVEQLSEREQLRRERQQRLYWQGQELRQQVLALEQQHVAAVDVVEARTALLQHIHAAVEQWAAAIGPELAGCDPDQRYQVLQGGIHGLLSNLAATTPPSCTADAGCDDADPGQSETQSRILIEHYRARLHQLRAQIHSRALIAAADVKAKAWAEARLMRDQLLAIPARCAAVADHPEALLQELMACLHL